MSTLSMYTVALSRAPRITRWCFGIIVGVYVGTAIVQSVAVDTLRIMGALEVFPQWSPQQCMTISMACLALAPLGPHRGEASTGFKAWRNLNRYTTKSLLVCAATDLFSGWCLYAGLLQVGGAIFVVVYSSSSAWTAVFAHMRGQAISPKQWAGVALCTTGLVANGYINVAGTSHVDGLHRSVLMGFALCLAGAVLHSYFIVDLNARLQDKRMQMSDRGLKPSPKLPPSP